MRKMLAAFGAAVFGLTMLAGPASADPPGPGCPTADPCTPSTWEEAANALALELSKCEAHSQELEAAYTADEARIERMDQRIGTLRFRVQTKDDRLARKDAEIARLRAQLAAAQN